MNGFSSWTGGGDRALCAVHCHNITDVGPDVKLQCQLWPVQLGVHMVCVSTSQCLSVCLCVSVSSDKSKKYGSDLVCV